VRKNLFGQKKKINNQSKSGTNKHKQKKEAE